MPRPFRPVCLGAALLCVFQLSSAAVRIVCDVDGRALPLKEVRDRSLVLADGDALAAAPVAGARWQLEGDVRENASLFHWAPDYAIRRRATMDSADGSDSGFEAEVIVQHTVDLLPDPKAIADAALRERVRWTARKSSPFQRTWPAATHRPAGLVFVWLVDGRPTQVKVEFIGVPSNRPFFASARFALKAGDERGLPVVLLWSGDGIVPPAPQFEREPAQALLVATLCDDPAAMNAAVKRGARLGATTNDGKSLMELAAGAGATRALEALAGRSRGTDRLEMLRLAAARGRVDVARSIVAGRRRIIRSSVDAERMLTAAIEGGHAGIVQALIDAGADVIPAAEAPNRHLVEAIVAGFPEVVSTILAANGAADRGLMAAASGHARGEDLAAMEATVLTRQARLRHLTMVRWLVEANGFDVNVVSGRETPLTAASANGDLPLIRFLLAAGADPNLAGASGVSPLMDAARADRPEAVSLLLAAGATARTATPEGLTALHFAAEGDSPAIATMLLDAGADVAICDRRQITPLDMALFAGAAETARLLVRRGACIGLGADYSSELLQAAICMDAVEPVRTAIEQGWPAESTFAGIWPALRVARLVGADGCAAVLQQAGAEAAEDRPWPVVDEGALDRPLRTPNAVTPEDPRGPEAEFPEQAVKVKFVVDPEGRPLFPMIVSAPDRRLRAPALRAAVRERFDPPLRDGKPTAALAVRELAFPASADRVFLPDQIETPPDVRQTKPAIYPESAWKADRLGRVVLEFVVDPAGHARDVSVVESSGPEFTEAALVAFARWSIEPGRHHGRPVHVRVTHSFDFARPPKT